MRGLIVAAIFAAAALAQPSAAAEASGPCVSPATPQVRSTLYFGRSRPKGTVSEREWRSFLRNEVTPRFPEGLTVLDAGGQWRGPAGVVERERSKVLLIEHPDTAAARRSIQDIIAAYRNAFEQESVLWESERVCVAR